jgi:hypothetical protein
VNETSTGPHDDPSLSLRRLKGGGAAPPEDQTMQCRALPPACAPRWRVRLSRAGALVVAASLGLGLSAGASQAEATLAQRYAALTAGPARPLAPGVYLESSEASQQARGEVLARLDLPYATAAAVLSDAQSWCRLLLLHPNVKHCLPGTGGRGGVLLDLTMAAQRDGLFGQEHPLQLSWNTLARDASHLAVELMAERGPMGTRDYRIGFELAPLEAGTSVMRLVYSSAFTATGLWMAQAYVATVARHRVGFTVVDTDAQGRPVYVRGVRAAVERNTMRFHLAVQSWLAVQPHPPEQRVARAIEAWFDASERHAAQLHEVEREEYVARKTAEFARVAGPEAPPRSR